MRLSGGTMRMHEMCHAQPVNRTEVNGALATEETDAMTTLYLNSKLKSSSLSKFKWLGEL